MSMSEVTHLGTLFYFHMHVIRIDTKSFSASLELQWTPRKTEDQPYKQQKRVGTLLPHFEDVVIIVSRHLNSIPITLQYDKMANRQYENMAKQA